MKKKIDIFVSFLGLISLCFIVFGNIYYLTILYIGYVDTLMLYGSLFGIALAVYTGCLITNKVITIQTKMDNEPQFKGERYD